MKNSQFLLLLLISTIAAACKKEAVISDDPIIPPPTPIYVPIFESGDTTKGAAYASKLTEAWSSDTYCKMSFSDSTKLSIIFFTYDQEGSRRESLSFAYFSKINTGIYRFSTAKTGINNLPLGEVSTTYGTWSSDGDVTEDYYLMDSTDQKNSLEITKIDLANKRVEGTFHASYNLQEPRINPLNPKKVTFSVGHFWATIRD
jgi:hypothetical protein